jgi:hypothetical protein
MLVNQHARLRPVFAAHPGEFAHFLSVDRKSLLPQAFAKAIPSLSTGLSD